jgi:hypothetical protein
MNKKEPKKSFTLKSMLIIAIIFFVVGRIVAYSISAVAGDALGAVGDIFFFIWIIRGLLYLSKRAGKNNTNK